MIDGSRDNVVKLPLESDRLQPFKQYYYRFIHKRVVSRTGAFKTLPTPGSNINMVKFGVVVCQDYGNGFYNAYRFLATEQIDYVLFLGDYIYETFDSSAFQNIPYHGTD